MQAVSRDGSWYWDGRVWRSTVTADDHWGWDGRRWIPVRSGQPKSRPASRNMSVSVLVGLLILDVVGFIPGVSFVTSVLAAAVLLVMDARGLVTLNGFIKWKRIKGRLRILVGFLEIALFQFLVLVYLTQRLYEMATDRPSPTLFDKFESFRESSRDQGISPTQLDADAIRLRLNTLLSETKNRLPQDLFDKVRAVVAAIDDILPVYCASDLGSQDRFVVERTADDYLPSAVHSYLRLPAAYRSISLEEAGGKTASQVLSDQLDLLSQRMRQVVDVAYRKDVDALLVHGRFLHSKFGRSSLELRT